MTSWMLGIVGTLLTALIFYIVRRCTKMVLTHRSDHKFLQQLKTSQNDHKIEHQYIKNALDIITKGNMHMMQDKILQKHKKAMIEGYISVHDYKTFKNLCLSYYESNGNSFIPKLEEEVDKLPHTRIGDEYR